MFSVYLVSAPVHIFIGELGNPFPWTFFFFLISAVLKYNLLELGEPPNDIQVYGNNHECGWCTDRKPAVVKKAVRCYQKAGTSPVALYLELLLWLFAFQLKSELPSLRGRGWETDWNRHLIPCCSKWKISNQVSLNPSCCLLMLRYRKQWLF